jgi:cyanate permease
MAASPPEQGVEGVDAESPAADAPPVAQSTMTWPRAVLIGLSIFVYFSVATMWLPSKLIRLGSVASAAQWIQNVTVTGSWFIALAVGFVALRQAQKRGWI